MFDLDQIAIVNRYVAVTVDRYIGRKTYTGTKAGSEPAGEFYAKPHARVGSPARPAPRHPEGKVSSAALAPQPPHATMLQMFGVRLAYRLGVSFIFFIRLGSRSFAVAQACSFSGAMGCWRLGRVAVRLFFCGSALERRPGVDRDADLELEAGAGDQAALAALTKH
jgi:hypothetical protein